MTFSDAVSVLQKQPTLPLRQVFRKKQHAVVGVFYHQPQELRTLTNSNIYNITMAGEKTNTSHGVKIKGSLFLVMPQCKASDGYYADYTEIIIKKLN